MKSKKASNISEIFEAFDVAPLKGEDIDFYYEKRSSPIDKLATILRTSKTPLKFLFSGYRGSGKSTELNILSKKIENRYFVVKFSVFETLTIHDITHIDLLLTIASEIYKQCYNSGIKVSNDLCKDLSEWMIKRTKIEITEEKACAGFEAVLNYIFAKLGTKMRAEATTREEIRKELKPKLSDLIEKINTMIYDIETKSQLKNASKKIIVIIDDLDKLDLKEAEDLFYNYSNSLTTLNCSIIYTFPIALAHSNMFTQIKQNFTDVYILPNIRISKIDGKKDEEERAILKRIVEKRMNIELISDDALNSAIENSGGNLYQFIYIIRFASIEAIMRNSCLIEIEDVNKIIIDRRNEFDRILRKEHYPILEKIRKTKTAVDGELLLELFHNQSVLEYLNDKRWCDVHPLVVPLLEERLKKLK